MGHPAEFERARLSIGTDDIDYANWLLGFSELNLDALSTGAWEDLQWKVEAFSHFPHWPDPDDVFGQVRPQSRKTIGAFHRLLRTMRRRMGTHAVQASFCPDMAFTFELKDGRLLVTEETTLLLLGQQWHLKVCRLLQRVQKHFRLCCRLDCGRAFFARHGRQRFCSVRCSQTTRQRHYRKKDPDRMRRVRRDLYRRAKDAKLQTVLKEVCPGLIRYVGSILRDRERAQDVVYQHLADLIERTHKRGPRGIRNPGGWLRTVVNRQVWKVLGEERMKANVTPEVAEKMKRRNDPGRIRPRSRMD